MTVNSISLHNAVPVCIVLRAEVCINHGVYAVNAQARFLAELFIVQALTIAAKKQLNPNTRMDQHARRPAPEGLPASFPHRWAMCKPGLH